MLVYTFQQRLVEVFAYIGTPMGTHSKFIYAFGVSE